MAMRLYRYVCRLLVLCVNRYVRNVEISYYRLLQQFLSVVVVIRKGRMTRGEAGTGRFMMRSRK